MELVLTRQNNDVRVFVDESESHSFSISDLALAENDFLAFIRNLETFGARLYRALFPENSPAQRARSSLKAKDALLIVTQDPDLQRIPWEYLRDSKDYLTRKYFITRGLPREQRIAWAQNDAADSVSVVVAASDPLVYPNGAPVVALNVKSERANVKAAFEKTRGAFRVTFIKPPTLDALHKQLAETNRQTIIHFIGHGIATKEGARLAFEDNAGAADSVEVSALLAGARVFLVFLNSCETAMSLESSASNLAHALVSARVPYALGMQFEVPEAVALRLSEIFYPFLAQGNSVEESLWHAREAMWTKRELENGLLSDEGAIDLRAFAAGIPVLYTALTSRPPALLKGEGSSTLEDFFPRDQFDERIPPPQKFRGRVSELARLGRLFEFGYVDEKDLEDARRREKRMPAGAKVIVLRGEGGMGKSTLARVAAERFGWRFSDGILGISLEDFPSKDTVIARLGKFLLGDAFEKLDEHARESAVVSAARARRALLILDNFETCVEGLGQAQGQAHRPAPTAAADARALAPFLARIAGGATTLLITSRASVTGLAGVRELLLEGLDEDAGRELFWDFAAQKRRATDDSLVDEVVDKVGGHPLIDLWCISDSIYGHEAYLCNESES
ncbi:MAG: CHAT domain-containing protein [Chloroflexi bacterium]|nr:CHAT domain-containing protein [Chloroflexota bacterium]